MSTADEPWLRVVGLMTAAERSMPDEFWGVAATQDLAQLCVELEGALTKEQMGRLVGVGAVLIRLGRDEAMAGIRAALAIRGIKPVNRG